VTAINHALTGAVIGLVIGEPLLAIPLAVASHYICDALPHFGADDSDKAFRSTLFRSYLLIEAALCFLLVVVLGIARPEHWIVAAVCAFAAAAPDLLWVRHYLAALHHKKWQPNAYDKFAGAIQWFQHPIGSVVELAWFIAAILVLAPFFAR
jgi:hypothetical protein